MAGARLNDSGSYLCQPFSRNVTEELPVANISVHVIKGANIDQLSGVSSLSNPLLLLLFTISLIIGIDPTNIVGIPIRRLGRGGRPSLTNLECL